jgi:hypothetical protein
MAQTVALQRGSTTVSGDGNAYANLFTQSSGTATRVIINGVACYSNTADYQIFAGLLVKSAGSSTNVLTIGLKSFGGASLAAFDFGSYDSNESNFTGYSTTSTIPFSNKVNMGWATGGVGTSFGGVPYTAGGVTVIGGGTSSAINSNQATYFSVPRDFWIGPSDVVSVKIFGGNIRSWTVAYSFTTITES